MKGYNLVKLEDMINELGEDRLNTILLNFSCPSNKDVEHFLHHTSIEFAKQRLSITYLLFASYKNNPSLIGYFTLGSKTMLVPKDVLSKNLQKRITKFGVFNSDLKRYLISSPLIAQLSKNFNNGLDKLITGDELLKIACDKVSEAHSIIGGRIVYLECEDRVVITNFYERNGFVKFGKRLLDQDELDFIHGNYLVQMLKYLK